MFEIHNEKDLEEAIEASGVKVFVFSAPWCGPCQRIKPKLVQLDNAAFHIKTYMINVDNVNIGKFGFRIGSVPTFIKFLNSERIGEVSGANIDGVTRLYK